MRFSYKNRGFVVVTLTAMLVVVGAVNYKLSQESLTSISQDFKDFETAQSDKNSTETSKENAKDKKELEVVDSSTSEIDEKVTETSKEMEEKLLSEENMQKSSYVLDMKMTREKQRNDLSQELNEMINNPSTSASAREEASDMKLKLVKNQETELKIEQLLSAKGYENSLVYISDEKVNVIVNQEKIQKEEAANIFDLVAEQASVGYEDIKITPNK